MAVDAGDGSVGCGKARDLAILFGCSQCSGSVYISYGTLVLTDPQIGTINFFKNFV